MEQPSTPPSAAPRPRGLSEYHVFIAWPGDVARERVVVRDFFERYNHTYAEPRGLHFEVLDYVSDSSAGVGRPQELTTRQLLERHRESLALVVGIMAQKFGSDTGTHESGTEEEFEWAVRRHRESETGLPEVKWFFKDSETLTLDKKDPEAALAQWRKVEDFRKRVEAEKAVYCRTYTDLDHLRKLLEDDVGRWLNDPDRPWHRGGSPRAAASAGWPPEVVRRLASELADDFTAHMRVGEAISAEQARARYVPALVRLRADPGAKEPTEGPLEDVAAQNGAQLLVVGPGGGGKTTMLRHLAAAGARRAVEDPGAPVHVFLRLAGFDRAEGGLDTLLGMLAVAARLDRAALEARWREGPRPMVVLLDGLNEVARAYRTACAEAILSLLQGSHAAHRYVITSRPGGELEGVAGQAAGAHRLRVADVREFGPEQVEQYLVAQGRGELKERLSDYLRALAGNPFLLWAITRTLSASPDIRSRGRLFEALIDEYIFEKRERAKRPRPPTDYNYRLIKKPILARLALTMIADGVTEVEDGPGLVASISAPLRALAKQAEDREQPLEAGEFMPKRFAAAKLLREAVDNGVLVREGEHLRFMHESVQEYFAAAALRTATVAELLGRAPTLNLAQLEARGPMFETLVTWAGLADTGRVAELAAALADAHPLLAAHLAAEAELPDDQQDALRQRFFALTASENEQRARLGAMGLTLLPSGRPEVVARLIGMLDGWVAAELAEKALKRTPTRAVLPALLQSWCARADVGVSDRRATLLRELVVELGHGRAVAEVLIDAWRGTDVPRDRLVTLAAGLSAKEPDARAWPATFPDTLTALAAEADLAGDVERSASIDALRREVERAPVPKVGLGATIEHLNRTLASLSAHRAEREQLAAAYAGLDDEALARVVREGTAVQQAAALGQLVTREAPAAVEHVLERVIETRQIEWLTALQSLPRALVRRQLAERLERPDDGRRARTRALADVLAEVPDCGALDGVFESSGAELRVLAARAAGRAGPEGVHLLTRCLARERSPDVLGAIIETMGASGSRAAADVLLDLLFDPVRRQGWPHLDEELIHDQEEHTGQGADGWGPPIHAALATLGEADRTLDRVATGLHSTSGGLPFEAVLEARRWLPSPRAAELLRQAMAHENVEVARWAKWGLACAGDAEAWRALLQAELDSPPMFISFAQDAARRLGTSVTEPSRRDALVAASQHVLRPALTSADSRRRSVAVDRTARLPDGWVEGSWRRDVLAAAEELGRSSNPEERRGAVRALHRFADDGEARVLELLLNDPDDAVLARVSTVLGDREAPLLDERLQRALRDGDGIAAGRAGVRVWASYDLQRRRVVRQSIAGSLDAGDLAQAAAALVALAPMSNDGDDVAGEGAALVARARAALQRHGVERLWAQFAAGARVQGARQHAFLYQLLDALQDDPQEDTLLGLAEELWPADLEILGRRVVADLRHGHKDRAADRLDELVRRFPEGISDDWLGDRYANLDRPSDALAHYRKAADRDPDRPAVQFAIGWLSFVTGDYGASVEATQRALALRPDWAMAECNLAVALLAQGDGAGAQAAYRRGVALARRQPPEEARRLVESALGDLALLPALPEGARAGVDRVRAWLEQERDRLPRSAPDA